MPSRGPIRLLEWLWWGMSLIFLQAWGLLPTQEHLLAVGAGGTSWEWGSLTATKWLASTLCDTSTWLLKPAARPWWGYSSLGVVPAPYAPGSVSPSLRGDRPLWYCKKVYCHENSEVFEIELSFIFGEGSFWLKCYVCANKQWYT